MQHLDEGTIHAWLDGELPFEESSRVAAHAESCDRCTALIAEARGFVAASSRILRSLDDVPGGVLPDTDAAKPERTGFTPRDWGIVLPVPRRHEVRRWLPSRFTAAAAVAVLAVGTYTILNQNRAVVSNVRAPAAVGAAADAAPQLVDSLAFAAPVAVGARQGPANPSSANAVAASTSRAAVPREDRAVQTTAKTAAPAIDMSAAPPSTVTPSAPATAARGRQSVATAAALTMSKVDSAVRRDDVDARVGDVLRAPVRDSSGRLAREQSLGRDTVVAAGARRLSVSLDSQIAYERRRLLGETEAQLRMSSLVTTGTTAAANEGQRLAAPRNVTTAVGCYDLRRSDGAAEAGVPARVRLADIPVRVEGRTLRVAVPDDLRTGERWYWSLGGGAIRLHKVVDGVVLYEGAVVAVKRGCA